MSGPKLCTRRSLSTRKSRHPAPGFAGLRVYVPQRQRVLVKEAEEFQRLVVGLASERVVPIYTSAPELFRV